tara:strand:+ start:497 stop:682 length:186 start_codon:yes stop_codon:yes gene_type:complete
MFLIEVLVPLLATVVPFREVIEKRFIVQEGVGLPLIEEIIYIFLEKMAEEFGVLELDLLEC